MSVVAFYAHFDEDNLIRSYVLDSLERLAPHCERLYFISTSRLSSTETAKLKPFVTDLQLRPNEGFDFAMWQFGLERYKTSGQSVLLTNSSVIGPLYPLGPICQKMNDAPCDFWGMTDSHECTWHLQSYFLMFKPPLVDSDAFRRFWGSVLPYRDKHQLIRSYELGLSTYLSEQGFKGAAYAAVDSWASVKLKARMARQRRMNPTLYFPLELLDRGMPFVKRSLFLDPQSNKKIKPVLDGIRASGYPMGHLPLGR